MVSNYHHEEIAVNELCAAFNSAGSAAGADYPNRSKSEKRVLILKQMVKAIERSMNTLIYSKLGQRISLKPTISQDQFGTGTFPLKISHMVARDNDFQNATFAVNIKAHDLLNLPPEALYASLSAAIYNGVLTKKNNSMKREFQTEEMEYAFHKNNAEAEKENKKEIELHVKQKHAKSVIASYLKGFLQDFYEEEFSDFKSISEWVALELIEGLDAGGIDKLLSDMFTSEFLERAKDEVEEFLGSSKTSEAYNSRIKRVGEHAEEAYKVGDEPTALSYDQQCVALINQRTKSTFNEIKEVSNNSQVRNFCIEYVNSFMSSNKLDPISVTFDNVGDLGTFFDGPQKSININLTKIRSISELVMTLSHELTHAIDSLNNIKSKKVSPKSQSGLINNEIQQDIKEYKSEFSPQEFELLKKINNYCYHLNPNERRARIGELSAIKFMQEVAGDKYQEQLAQSIGRYTSFQQRTIEMAKAIKDPNYSGYFESFEGLKRQYEAIKPKLTKKQQNLFEERLQFLEDCGKAQEGSDLYLDIEREQESVKDAVEIFRGQVIEAKEKDQREAEAAKKQKRNEEIKAAARITDIQPGM